MDINILSRFITVFFIFLCTPLIIVAEEEATHINEIKVHTMSITVPVIGRISPWHEYGLLTRAGYRAGQKPNPFLVLSFNKTSLRTDEPPLPLKYTFYPVIRVNNDILKWIKENAITGTEYLRVIKKTKSGGSIEFKECKSTYLRYSLSIDKIVLARNLDYFAIIETGFFPSEHRKIGNTIDLRGSHSRADGIISGPDSTEKLKIISASSDKLKLKCEKPGNEDIAWKVYAQITPIFYCVDKDGIAYASSSTATEHIEGSFSKSFTCAGGEESIPLPILTTDTSPPPTDVSPPLISNTNNPNPTAGRAYGSSGQYSVNNSWFIPVLGIVAILIILISVKIKK